MTTKNKYFFPVHYHDAEEIILPQPKRQTYVKNIIRTILYFKEGDEYFINTQALLPHLLELLVEDDEVDIYFHTHDSKFVNWKWAKDNNDTLTGELYLDGMLKEAKKRRKK